MGGSCCWRVFCAGVLSRQPSERRERESDEHVDAASSTSDPLDSAPVDRISWDGGIECPHPGGAHAMGLCPPGPGACVLGAAGPVATVPQDVRPRMTRLRPPSAWGSSAPSPGLWLTAPVTPHFRAWYHISDGNLIGNVVTCPEMW